MVRTSSAILLILLSGLFTSGCDRGWIYDVNLTLCSDDPVLLERFKGAKVELYSLHSLKGAYRQRLANYEHEWGWIREYVPVALSDELSGDGTRLMASFSNAYELLGVFEPNVRPVFRIATAGGKKEWMVGLQSETEAVWIWRRTSEKPVKCGSKLLRGAEAVLYTPAEITLRTRQTVHIDDYSGDKLITELSIEVPRWIENTSSE